MLEPSLAFQSAVRASLVGSPNVTALVPASNVRAGATNTERMPSIILGGAQTEYLGRAGGSQHVARVSLDLHVWAVEDGADTARAIGMAALTALTDAPTSADFERDEYEKPSLVWLRDPQPERAYTHGVMSLEAAIRWST